MRVILWHGSGHPVSRFDPAATADGGVHFGSLEQARMRNHACLHEVQITVEKVLSLRDPGVGWKSKIRRARAQGYDAIRYLNRYEGISAQTIDRLTRTKQIGRLDGLSDAEFRKLVPEARESLIVFDAASIKILRIVEARRGATPKTSVAPDEKEEYPSL